MRLGVVQGDGAALRTHLERAHSSTGQMDAQLAAVLVPLPRALVPVWDVFVTLSGTRAPSAEGAAPISCAEMQAWQGLTGVRLTAWEVDTLLQMDQVARATVSETRKPAS